jgi:signal transduction histidine kinase
MLSTAAQIHATRTQRPHARLAVMRAIQVVVGRERSIEELCRSVRRELAEALGMDGFVVCLYDDVSQMVEVVHQTESDVELPGGSFPLGHGFMSEVIRARQPRLIRHWSVDGPRVQVQYATDKPGLPESTITVPLLIGDRAVGVLSLQSYAIDAYDEDDLLLVQGVAAHVAPALEILQRGAVAHTTRRVSELEAILSSMTEGLLVLDRDGRIVSLNPPARAMFGQLGDGVVLGQRLDREQWGKWPLGAQAVAEALAPVLEALARGEACSDLEVEVNGEGRRVLSFSSAKICDAAGQHGGGVVVFRDVTSQRDVARMKDELLSIASHDLRTPVTVLKGQAQLMQRALRRGDLDVDSAYERMDLMVQSTDRLAKMLNLLLDLSRIEAGRLDLTRERMDLVLLVRRVALAVQALTNKHTIEVHAPSALEGVWDTTRLEQVIQNLLTNAVKYAPEGGPVTVRVEAGARSATVSVTDRGLGIAAEALPQVFDRFYRVPNTRSLEGSGLGLYICQAIIAAHGGRLWAESEGRDMGSTFTFSLPY